MVTERYGGSSQPTLDQVPLPEGELSHLLTRNPVLDELSSFDLRGKKRSKGNLFSVLYTVWLMGASY